MRRWLPLGSVAVSLSLASTRGSVPIAYQLYLPQDWAHDPVRRQGAGVPGGVAFATKPAIALEQMRQAISQGVRPGVVLADAGYGDETAFRDGITAMGMLYAVGIRPATTVWAPGMASLPPKPWVGRGIRPTKLRRESGHEPVNARALAMGLEPQAWRTVTWREGTNAELSGRFAALRVRPAHRDYLQTACASRSGCSSSGPKARRNRPSISSAPPPSTRPWNSWCSWPRCAGASSATTRT